MRRLQAVVRADDGAASGGDERQRRGALIARLLAGSWRSTDQTWPAGAAAELAVVVPPLIETRSAALAWWRLRTTELADAPALVDLRDAYALHALEHVWHQQTLSRAISALHAAGVDPILLKGLAVARRYAEPGLRPYLDHDLLVRPSEWERAVEVLAALRPLGTTVDLHASLDPLPRGGLDELYARTQMTSVNQTEVRVLGAEDQLRLLSRHTLRHGVRRPIWLCDLGVWVETLGSDFDWEYCLRGHRGSADWIAIAVGLAAELLDARLRDWWVLRGTRQPPAWMVAAVLRAWGGGRFRLVDHEAIGAGNGRPGHLVRQATERWPSSITSTYWAVVQAERWPSAADWVWASSRAGGARRALEALQYATLVCRWARRHMPGDHAPIRTFT